LTNVLRVSFDYFFGNFIQSKRFDLQSPGIKIKHKPGPPIGPIIGIIYIPLSTFDLLF